MPLDIVYPHDKVLKSIEKKHKNKNFDFIKEAIDTYENFRNNFIDAVDKKDLDTQKELLSAYRKIAKSNEKAHKQLGSRTKYYSSLMEEIPIYIVKDLVEEAITNLSLNNYRFKLGGGLNCTIRITSNPDGSIFLEKKQIDFSLSVESEPIFNQQVIIPLIGLEVKKYTDKTMFGTILQTYQSIKIFRPRTYYGFVVEDEARDSSVVLNSIMYKNEFILTGKKRQKNDEQTLNPIDIKAYTIFVETLQSIVIPCMSTLKIKLDDNGCIVNH